MLPLYTGIDGEEKQGICIGTENYLAINKKVSKELRISRSISFTGCFQADTGKKYVTEKLNFNYTVYHILTKRAADDRLQKEFELLYERRQPKHRAVDFHLLPE